MSSMFGPQLPYEARVDLLDSEEDLMTAAARADQAVRDVQSARADVDAARERYEGLKGSPLKTEAKASVDLARARLDRAARSSDLLAAAQACAERRYAAARAQAEVKFNVEGASASSAGRLASKADECESRLDKPREALAASEEALEKARSAQDHAALQAAAQAPAQYPRPWLE
jgi:hypothetical protein